MRERGEAEMREAISAAFQTITPDMIRRATQQIVRRAELCLETQAGYCPTIKHADISGTAASLQLSTARTFCRIIYAAAAEPSRKASSTDTWSASFPSFAAPTRLEIAQGISRNLLEASVQPPYCVTARTLSNEESSRSVGPDATLHCAACAQQQGPAARFRPSRHTALRITCSGSRTRIEPPYCIHATRDRQRGSASTRQVIRHLASPVFNPRVSARALRNIHRRYTSKESFSICRSKTFLNLFVDIVYSSPAMATDFDPARAKKRRSIVKSACTRIKTYVDSITAVTPRVLSQLEERKGKLEQYWTEYNDVQTELEMYVESEQSDRIAFEDAFYELSSRIRDRLRPSSASRNVTAPSPTPSNVSDAPSSSFNVRLPKLDLPKFSGKYDEWVPFCNAFRSAIHSNPSLSNVHKLQYLRAATNGDAHKVICSLEISDENYPVAWNLLNERYDNKRVIVQSHLKALIELPIMKKESAAELRQIADGAARHVQALKALKRPTDNSDDLLVYLLSAKLDPNTTRDWQKSLANDKLPTFQEFSSFLVQQCQVLESTQRSSGAGARNATSRSQSDSKQKTTCNAAVQSKCNYCQAGHSIYQCKKFSALSVQQRIENARSRKLCLNCLRPADHATRQCPSGSCRVCSRKHNTLLHLQGSASDQAKVEDETNQVSNPIEATASNSTNVVATHSYRAGSSDCVMLSTALVIAEGNNDLRRSCRVLLDSGSQTSFVTREFVRSLGLTPRSTNVSISGIGGAMTCSKQAVQITLRSRLNSSSLTVDCIVADRITDDLPSFTIKRSAFDLPRNLPLADPNFNVSSGIDVLIGAEAFWSLLCVGQIRASNRHPLLQKTRLGWILAGKLNAPPPPTRHVRALHSAVSNSTLHQQLAKLWHLEDISNDSQALTSQEKICENHFASTVTRDAQGRYIVQLPFKQELVSELGHSRDIALKRFFSLERRFARQPTLRARYSEFMQEYLALGHMRPIREEPTSTVNAYYLPHHCVVKEDAKGTKLRVVFDGSCKTETGLSLNDCLLTGPVLVHQDHTRFQRILWRQDKSAELRTFELLTVTYGTASASYLATRCLTHLADHYSSEFPVDSLRLRRDFYVDDLLTGADTKSEALTIRDQIILLLRQGCMELSKWGSNCAELLENVNDLGERLVSFDKESNFLILGILWDREEDTFHFSFTDSQTPSTISKRSILSEVSSLFDPLGLIGPVIVVAKVLLQELWQLGLDWDESIPQDLHAKWIQIKTQLPDLSALRIPRRVKYQADPNRIQVHGYCDASQLAYGACIYVRSQIDTDSFRSQLLCSRSRVAPLKALSLPRLELSAALLLAQLVDN
ncbi:uncharacterized protein LOC118644436 [Monomorium pharaonis]|uniref:uncharacterized protein LOC118644436 n=1 Tax=Monomorium pharaonis TaxID=307658 RepID=UPI001746A1F7|nr:uncharacterized protein LOC118644436 [Monomorium pharaonis]